MANACNGLVWTVSIRSPSAGTDYYSRWVSVDILQESTSVNIINRLRHSFATHGLPECIVTDNGPPFLSKEFKTYLQEHGITHHRVTPYWPQANVERQNRTLCKAIRAAHAKGKDWRTELDVFLLACRSTPHCVTGRSQAELLFNPRSEPNFLNSQDHSCNLHYRMLLFVRLTL